MIAVTIRLPDGLLAEIEAEARETGISRSAVIGRRLVRVSQAKNHRAGHLEGIKDLVGSVHGLPADLSARVDHYVRKTGFGR